jgi:hypothetical protein
MKHIGHLAVVLLVAAARAPVEGSSLAFQSDSASSASTAAASTLKAKGALTVTGMRVASNAAEGSLVHFGADSAYTVGTDATGQFAVQKAGTSLLSLDQSNVLHVGSANIQAQALDVSGELKVGGVAQWRLVMAEDFLAGAAMGWSRQEVSSCGGVHMLGGYCKFGQGEVEKSFGPLPPHTQLKIKATYHFIDQWIGESAYLKMDVGRDGGPAVVWSERHSQEGQQKGGVNVCGQAATPEGKFATPIEITVPHTLSTAKLIFGSTMDSQDPCDESWGVSGIEVYVK